MEEEHEEGGRFGGGDDQITLVGLHRLRGKEMLPQIGRVTIFNRRPAFVKARGKFALVRTEFIGKDQRVILLDVIGDVESAKIIPALWNGFEIHA